MSNDIGDVRARMTLDTTAFDSKLKQATASVEPSARAIEKAAKISAQAQATAAKYAGDAVTEQGRRIVAARAQEVQASRDLAEFQKAVSRGYLDEATASSASIAAVQKQIAARRTLNELMKTESGGHGFTDRMAASAVVRGLEGNSGIRSIENVLTMVPGFNAAAQTLAKVMGTAGLIGIAVELGEKLYTAFDVGGARARQTAEEVSRVSLELTRANTSLDVQIDKLQQEQAKLEKKPFNGTKLALDEAAEAAENLAARLDTVIQKQVQTIANMGASLPQRILAGGSNTGYEQSMLKEHNKWLDQAVTIQAQYNESVSYGNSLQTRLTELLGMKKATEVDALSAAQSGAAYMGSTYDEEIQAVRTLIGFHEKEHASIRKTMDLGGQEAATQAARDKSEAARIATEAGRRGDEAARKAAEARLHGMEDDLAQMKLMGNVTAKAEYDFWDARRNAFERGSQQYVTVIQKQAELAMQGARRFHEGIEKAKALTARETSGTGDLEIARVMAEYDKRIRDISIEGSKADRLRADAADELAVANARANASLGELAVNDAAGKTISQYDAAVQLATLHTQAYGVELDALNAKAQRIASARDLTDPQKQEQLGKVAVDATNLQRSQAAVMMRDQAAMGKTDTSALVGAKDELNELAAAARDSGKQLRDMIGTTLRSLNEAVLNPRAGGFREAGASIFRGASSTLLDKGEGYLLQAFGFGGKGGKPDGSASNPLHVVMAGGGFQMPTTLTNSVSKAAGMGMPSLSDLGSAMLGLLPAFAEGGDVMAGTMNIIGERGPEIFVPRSSGTVIPNSRAAGMFTRSGSAAGPVYVDARGSSSPAMAEAAARRGAMAGAAMGRAQAAQDRADSDRRRLGGVKK